ncbi:hypothetical protein GW17_00046203, partial [Ensete ventricosum]
IPCRGWRNAAAGAVGSSGSGFPISNIPIWYEISAHSNIEKVAEVALQTLEKVAEVTEKIASDVANALPEGDSLKEKALLIEKIAEKVEHDAKLAEAIIHEVGIPSCCRTVSFLTQDHAVLYNSLQNMQVDAVKEEVDTLMNPLLEKEQSEKEIQEEENESTDQPKAN